MGGGKGGLLDVGGARRFPLCWGMRSSILWTDKPQSHKGKPFLIISPPFLGKHWIRVFFWMCGGKPVAINYPQRRGRHKVFPSLGSRRQSPDMGALSTETRVVSGSCSEFRGCSGTASGECCVSAMNTEVGTWSRSGPWQLPPEGQGGGKMGASPFPTSSGVSHCPQVST